MSEAKNQHGGSHQRPKDPETEASVKKGQVTVPLKWLRWMAVVIVGGNIWGPARDSLGILPAHNAPHSDAMVLQKLSEMDKEIGQLREDVRTLQEAMYRQYPASQEWVPNGHGIMVPKQGN